MYGVANFATLGTGLLAAEGSLEWQGIVDAMTAQFTVANIVNVLALTITACIGLVFAWWGMRKTVRMVMSAFKKGRLRI